MEVRFASAEAQRSFDDKGYAIVDLLAPEDVRTLLDLALASTPTRFDGVFTNVHLLDYEQNVEIDRVISRVIGARIDAVLPGFRVPGGTFIVKSAQPADTTFLLHQDPNIVDERKHAALIIWAPLVDTGAHNGGLCVLPGSDAARATVRSVQLPSPLLDFEEFAPYVEQLTIRAGQACVLTQRLFHGSRPNTSGVPRPVVNGALIPRDTLPIYHFVDASGRLMMLEVLDSTFSYTGLRSIASGVLPPGMTVLETWDAPPPRLTRDEVLAVVAARRPPAPPPRRGLLSRFRELLRPAVMPAGAARGD